MGVQLSIIAINSCSVLFWPDNGEFDEIQCIDEVPALNCLWCICLYVRLRALIPEFCKEASEWHNDNNLFLLPRTVYSMCVCVYRAMTILRIHAYELRQLVEINTKYIIEIYPGQGIYYTKASMKSSLCHHNIDYLLSRYVSVRRGWRTCWGVMNS